MSPDYTAGVECLFSSRFALQVGSALPALIQRATIWRDILSNLEAMLRRREFITLVGGVVAIGPIAARAQQRERMRVIGILMPATADDPDFQARIAAFNEGLQRLGWTMGENVRFDTRWATTDAAEIRRHAADLAALAPDVILAHAATAVGPLLQATHTVPVVFPAVVDPVGAGFVDSWRAQAVTPPAS
jgi:putative tryptophan/tyrosine transport system substrate-binding protein